MKGREEKAFPYRRGATKLGGRNERIGKTTVWQALHQLLILPRNAMDTKTSG